MAAVDLIFSGALVSGPPVNLVFGDTDDTASDSDITLAIVLPTLQANINVATIIPAIVDVTLPSLQVTVAAVYESLTQRPLVGRMTTPWHETDRTAAGVHVPHANAVVRASGSRSPWQEAQRTRPAWELPHPYRLTADRSALAQRYQQAHRTGTGAIVAPHHDSIRVPRPVQSPRWQAAAPAGNLALTPWQDRLRNRRPSTRGRWAEAMQLHRRCSAAAKQGRAVRRALDGRWQEAMRPQPGRSITVIVAPPPCRCYAPPAGDAVALLFSRPWTGGANVLFDCPATTPVTTIVVAIRRVYAMINEVFLRRVADDVALPAFSLSLSLDAASWAWGFEAVLPATALSLIEPGSPEAGPIELLASVNGTAFRVLAENISRERAFGEASIRLSGRGRNAVLAAPYAPVMNFSNAEARTAQQLMIDALTHNGTPTGVPLGWSIDWGLEDWLVPAGVFSHQGVWIEALTAIASAAGGYLIPHPSAPTVRVRHRYPIAPWEWGAVTPDFVLPADVVARESLRWRDLPTYNRVFVSGQEVGVLGQVTRAGTAGDVLAPMVVDALITEAAAARQRGLAILADTGRQIEVTLRLPVLAETGIIEPGAFVRYEDASLTRLGLVRSTRIEAGLPEVWQTLGVQAYA